MMKVSTINAVITVCLVWLVLLFVICYWPSRLYDNPPPSKPAYDISKSEGAANVASTTSPATSPAMSLEERLLSGSVEHGKKVFSDCTPCHTPLKDGPNRVGPRLWGMMNRPFAAFEGYSYSSAMRRAQDEGKVWDYQTLDDYLKAPQHYVRGTIMSYLGIKDDQARADLILYLRTLGDTMPPLPASHISKGN